MSEPAPVATARDLRMLTPALIGWLTCALAISLHPGTVVIVGCVFACLVLVSVLIIYPRARGGNVLAAVVIAAVMLVAFALGEAQRNQAVVEKAVDSEVVADIRLSKTFSPGLRSINSQLLGINGTALSHGGTPLRVVGAPLTQRAPLGSTLRVSGYLQRASPGERSGWVLIIREGATQVTPPGWFLSGTDALRVGFLERSLERPGDGGRLLPGLALGDTSAVDAGLVEAMRATSLSHLVAVSGANCAIVVALVVAVVALLGGGLWIRMAAGILALAGFVVLVTPEPSIIRASIMASIVLFFLATARPVRGIPVLGLSVLILLALDPWLALDFAFALSVVATGGILLLTGPVTERLSVVMPPALALVIALPLAAQIACGPILILLNPIIPVWAVVANAVAAPAAPLATIVGMMAALAGPLFPALADLLVGIAWWPSAFIAATGRSLADSEIATLAWPPGWWGALTMGLMSYAGIAAILLSSARHRRWRRVLGAVSLSTVVIVLVSFSVPNLITRASVPGNWSIAQCDVGQGDSLVLRSEGQVALIDTGGNAQRLNKCLDFLGIDGLDIAIITHFDLDHVGGWRALTARVDRVWIGSNSDQKEIDIAQSLAQSGAKVQQVVAGDSAVVGKYRLDVVWPVAAAFSEPGNDSSVVVALSSQSSCEECFSGLFLGDLGEKPQRILQGRQRFSPVDVVKVGHHGSADQFEGLYQALGAKIGLIGVGSENTYGHPTDSALAMLVASGTVPLRSDVLGMVVLAKNDAGEIVVWSEKSPAPR